MCSDLLLRGETSLASRYLGSIFTWQIHVKVKVKPNLVNRDTERAIESVRLNRVSVYIKWVEVRENARARDKENCP